MLDSNFQRAFESFGDALTGILRLRGSVTPYLVRAILEQRPNANSRVKLAEQRDRFGLRRIALDLQWSEADKRSVRRAAKLFGAALGASGLGRLQTWLSDDAVDLGDPTYASHHMGTTRMSSDPKKGVVDGNCRVHGIANFYIAGSSVFPSYGWSNPTLTIVALAVRLARHIVGELR